MPQPDESSRRDVPPLLRERSPARIVVAERDAALRELIIAQLLDDGHEVYGASSVYELLHLLAAGGSTIPPVDGADLIVLDENLPGMSGLEIVRRLRGARSRIPMLLLTASHSSELLRETARLGIQILVKPFSPADLSNSALLLMLTGSGPGAPNDRPAHRA